MTAAEGSGAGRRLAALIALIALVLGSICVVAAAISNIGVLLVVLVSLIVAVIGAWYVVSRRGLTRVIATVVVLVGLSALVVGVVVGDPNWVGIVLAIAFGATSVAAATYALRGDRQERAMPFANEPALPAANHPVLIMNPKSGGGKAVKFDLVTECKARGIEPIVLQQGDDLLQLASDAVARGADVIGMAGGDGSQALVSSVASEHGIPHVVIPAGTRNHFALDLGLDRDDVVGALDAFSDGIERLIDLADVNGRIFVNNASLGLYAKIVQSDEYRDSKLQTTANMLPDLLGPEAEPLDLRYTGEDGTEVPSAHLIQVSNDPYDLTHVVGGGTRPALDLGVLGIVTMKVGDPAKGWHAPSFEIRSDGPVEVGVDGEALTMDPPLRFTSHPRVLRVRLPRHAPGASPSAKAVHLSGSTGRELAQLIMGHPSGAA
jgi:diacylglycerol kinase family enzyme